MKCPVRMLCLSVMLLVLLLAGTSDDSQACNVPAFRYALERWPADPYQVLVYYEPTSKAEAFGLLNKRPVNYSLRSIDVTSPEGKALAEQRKIVDFPWLEVFYPVHVQARVPLWSGPLKADTVAGILDSPARSGLAKRLLGGEVAVWVLIRSGREREDTRAIQTLKTNLERASSTLRMPVIGTDLNGNPIEVTDFKTYPVHFGLMEVARDDAREEMLVNSLLQSEPDLAEQDEPMAFPVFGRGRALYALVGDGIQERTIMEACQSLIAWCSCEIKAQNPGTDLLISADWSRPYGGRMVQNPELPPLAGLAGFSDPKVPESAARSTPDPVTPSAACPLQPPAGSASGPVRVAVAPQVAGKGTRRDPLVRNVLYLAGGAGLLLLAFSVFVTVKTKK